ncbi:MAG: glycoside hydrolase family 127 protein [Clostridia bacterium]|nr:glycoside hydrolase family 127 protein [Clostridia bacterium]
MENRTFSKMSYSRDLVRLSEPSKVSFRGIIDDRMRALEEGLFLRVSTEAVTSYFRDRTDPFAAGEFFGKLLRACVNVCAYTGSVRLRRKCDEMVEAILECRDPDGCISTVPRENQPNGSNGSDLWERKYILLGLWEYFERFGPTLKSENDVVDAMLGLAKYTASQIGDEKDGKTPITKTGWAFCGIESSSILEPVMKIYGLTNDPALLDLARHIIGSGACARENLFEGIASGKSPAMIGNNGKPEESIAKAYEMMSCFEGLIEYYRVTGDENALSTARVFLLKIEEEEINFLGSGGADKPFNLGPGTGEQWNFCRSEQANPDVGLTMETCVTVTYMKLLLQYYRVTLDSTAIDRLEVSMYNALLGASHEDGSSFEYFSVFNGYRSGKQNFVYDVGGFPLSCCTANGPMGLAILPMLAAVTDRSGKIAYVNLYAPFKAEICCGLIEIDTRYPEDGVIRLKIIEKGSIDALAFRIPGFCESFTLSRAYSSEPGYAVVEGPFENGETITLELKFGPACVPSPKSVNPEAAGKILFTYGPLVLARDKKYDSAFDSPLSPEIVKELSPVYTDLSAGTPFMLKCPAATFVPYFAAGRSFSPDTEYRCWIKRM